MTPQKRPPVLRSRLRPAQMVLGVLLVIVIAVSEIQLVRTVFEVRDSTRRFSKAGFVTTNLANVQREALRLYAESHELLSARNFDQLDLYRSFLANQHRVLLASHADDVDTVQDLREMGETLDRYDALMAQLKRTPTTAAIESAMPKIHASLNRLDLITKRIFDREEAEFFADLTTAVRDREFSQRVLLFTTVLIFLFGGVMFVSVRRRVKRDFRKAYDGLLSEIDEREAAQAETLRERNRSQAILASIGDGAVVVDVNGIVFSVNPAMERLAGVRREEVVGRHVEEAFLVHDADGKVESFVGLSDALAHGDVGTTRGFAQSLVRDDGTTVPISVSAAPLVDSAGETTGVVAMVRDVSYEHEIDQLKSSLIATVSHELRTPLTMIKGFSELLLDRSPSEQKKQEALRHINRSADRLSHLIENVLSVSKIESDALTPSIEPVELTAIFEEAIALVPGGNRIRVTVEPEADGVLADHDALIQVVINLAANAVKYSEPEAEIEIDAYRKSGDVVVEVRDRGIGIPEDEIAHVFEKFYRSSQSEARNVHGTGLGLYITKVLLERQGATISAARRSGGGTVFTFSLPSTETSREEAHDKVAYR